MLDFCLLKSYMALIHKMKIICLPTPYYNVARIHDGNYPILDSAKNSGKIEFDTAGVL